ncbi:hypothetical protein KRX52_10700 [Pseudomonas sp. MAP12]|uniref:Type II restriction endonuclease n=1 Tax=Geopseudomonas aromaticivorans TaxID=2849492 RepID=A0ABS6MWV7_9GAMM|nr:hypothetical protein [Pseudomonas aromaticivorans]MBV2133266.1 hypothetical protein [Pseudomonas aromaticivorans]
MSTRPVVLKPACIKTLVAVEAHPERSHQHEFNGVAALKNMFGEDRVEFEAIFSVRGGVGTHLAGVTWYDSRENHPKRTEHRLYFQGNPVMDQAQEGDNVLIGFDLQNRLHCILIPAGAGSSSYAGWTPVE